MGLCVHVMLYTSDSWESRSQEQSWDPREAVEATGCEFIPAALAAVSSAQCGMVGWEHNFHYLQGAREEKLQLPGSWLAPWCASQTRRVLHSPNPRLPLHNIPTGRNDSEVGLEWMSSSESFLASAGSSCVPLSCSIIPLMEEPSRMQDHGDTVGNPQCERGRLSFVPR